MHSGKHWRRLEGLDVPSEVLRGGFCRYAPTRFLKNLNDEVNVFLHIIEVGDGYLTYSKHIRLSDGDKQ